MMSPFSGASSVSSCRHVPRNSPAVRVKRVVVEAKAAEEDEEDVAERGSSTDSRPYVLSNRHTTSRVRIIEFE